MYSTRHNVSQSLQWWLFVISFDGSGSLKKKWFSIWFRRMCLSYLLDVCFSLHAFRVHIVDNADFVGDNENGVIGRHDCVCVQVQTGTPVHIVLHQYNLIINANRIMANFVSRIFHCIAMSRVYLLLVYTEYSVPSSINQFWFLVKLTFFLFRWHLQLQLKYTERCDALTH